jgi:1-acyl-sn-glycerol-3-phosphate acyltransferase
LIIVFRAILFAVAFYGWSTILSPIYVPLMLLPRSTFWYMAVRWVASCLFIVRWCANIRYEIRGTENLPEEPYILASKHQSSWDTLIYNILFKECVYILKRELFWFPCFGWFLWRTGMIGVDRAGGARALRDLVAQARARLADGHVLVIFPQGTRVLPGTDRPYLPGVAALYAQCDTPIVPVALNSGLFWPRRQFVKQPGKIILEYLPPIEPGLDRRAFMKTLRERIETASHRLEIEGAESYGLELPAPATAERA